jgi:metal-dependent amidase/aminoacylase/carboxypeptidase family protein
VATLAAVVERHADGLGALSHGGRLDATVKLIGAPAEESGGGKVLLLQGRVFDDVAMAMMVHPAPETCAAAAPNIVPADTSALYYVRAPNVESLHQLETQGRACFEAGALALALTGLAAATDDAQRERLIGASRERPIDASRERSIDTVSMDIVSRRRGASETTAGGVL